MACRGEGAAALTQLGGGRDAFGRASLLDAGHSGAVNGVDWHPAGWALSGGADRTVRLTRLTAL